MISLTLAGLPMQVELEGARANPAHMRVETVFGATEAISGFESEMSIANFLLTKYSEVAVP
ncbi:hypothetical protein AUF78_11060 [archaeon 13_1_20CM_2_51_12]|nr:MAG: hypothetical protein AUI97_06415 [Crenarchaeota archaeon 13_1_40CM_3_52_17]OLE69485.1 MAG: hypothetical protein AUF78_11060 [archaeon 13_1_20CM_2_51_12]